MLISTGFLSRKKTLTKKSDLCKIAAPKKLLIIFIDSGHSGVIFESFESLVDKNEVFNKSWLR